MSAEQGSPDIKRAILALAKELEDNAREDRATFTREKAMQNREADYYRGSASSSAWVADKLRDIAAGKDPHQKVKDIIAKARAGATKPEDFQ